MFYMYLVFILFFFFQAEDGIRDSSVTGVQTCALPICRFGGMGQEKPAVVTAAGTRRDVSGHVRDFDDVFFASDGLQKLGEWLRANRSEERRVGKEGRSRWAPYH